MPTHLSTLRPSPTTILYTVSTSPNHPSLPAPLLLTLSLLLRLTLGICILSLNYIKYYSSPTSPIITPILSHLSWPVLIPLTLCILWLISRRYYIEESLLTLSSLGIQTSSTSSTYLLPATSRFIPTTQIRDIFIHEAFKGFEVRFYLCVVVDGEGEGVVVFQKLLPRREILEEVWRGSRECLWGGKG